MTIQQAVSDRIGNDLEYAETLFDLYTQGNYDYRYRFHTQDDQHRYMEYVFRTFEEWNPAAKRDTLRPFIIREFCEVIRFEVASELGKEPQDVNLSTIQRAIVVHFGRNGMNLDLLTDNLEKSFIAWALEQCEGRMYR